jgi:hypothetical protein
MWKIILITTLVFFSFTVTGCDSAPVTEAAFNNPENNHNFANPIKAGTLPDGRDVFMVEVAPTGYSNMVIFFTEDYNSVTTVQTKTRQNGKTQETYKQTQVFLNGSYHDKCELASNCKGKDY